MPFQKRDIKNFSALFCAGRDGFIMENKTFKKIAVITSGGDAQAMNAAVRAIALSAQAMGIKAVGINEAYYGMTHMREDDFIDLDIWKVDNIIASGGTILKSARFPEFKEKENVMKAAENLRRAGIDGLVAVGGDGTFRGASDLLNIAGIPCIGVPATIDNDITATDYSIGFDTAMNETMHMTDCLRDTCNSHKRCNIVETMGRGAGYIALYTGIAVGATAVIIPEKMNEFDKDSLIKRMIEARKAGKRSFIIMVSEGVMTENSDAVHFIEELNKFMSENAELSFDEITDDDGKDEIKAKKAAAAKFAKDFHLTFNAAYGEQLQSDIEAQSKNAFKELYAETGDIEYKDEYIETKFARYAHVVRGGSPTLRDRLIASQMGDLAVKELAAGKSNRVICMHNGRLTSMDFNDAMTVDKLYRNYNKGIVDEEKVNAMTDEQKEIYYRRIEELDRLYKLANTISEIGAE